MIGKTERVGAYGISVIGFFRAKSGKCDHCAALDVLHRVWSGGGDYRSYLAGEYCLKCARVLATAKADQGERARRFLIDKEWLKTL